MVKLGDIIVRVGQYFVEWSADEFAAPDNGDFLVLKFDVVAGEEPKDGGGSGGIVVGMLGI